MPRSISPFQLQRERQSWCVIDVRKSPARAMAGVIANLAPWFAMHVLFGEVGQLNFGILSVRLPVPESFDWRAAAIAALAVIALLKFRLNLIVVLAVAAGLGFLLAY